LSTKKINAKDVEQKCLVILAFITHHIDIEIARQFDTNTNFELNFIKPNVNTDLDNKTFTLADSEKKLESIRVYLNTIIETKEKKTVSTDYVKLHETEKNNYSLLCTARRCKLLEDSLPATQHTQILNDNYEFIVSKKNIEFHKQSVTNNSIVNPQINSLCKIITNIKIDMKETITSVFYKIIDDFDEELLDEIIKFVTFIDIINTKSKIANKYNFCKPTIDTTKDKSFINSKKMRHCLIEQIHTSELYVTNDIVLGDQKTDGILLYGTNAVGKTSLIRSIGICVIMAQAGLYVPCSEFTFKPYKHIFTRIIGNDNLFKGLSTFAVEMSELRTILRIADNNSLVLGDELCSGTENISAVSIFVAGIQRLYSLQSSFIFATHFHEIAKYDEIISCETLKLKHMTIFYNIELDKLIYDRKLKDGAGDSMYGLEVCKSLNLPNDFLELANNIRCKYHPETKSFLSLKTSRYNSDKLVGLCQKCNTNVGTEVHHIRHQKDADNRGIIDNEFHKDSLANLMTLCEKCHLSFHKL
jgi:DNA mismatch repair protein MutS